MTLQPRVARCFAGSRPRGSRTLLRGRGSFTPRAHAQADAGTALKCPCGQWRVSPGQTGAGSVRKIEAVVGDGAGFTTKDTAERAARRDLPRGVEPSGKKDPQVSLVEGCAAEVAESAVGQPLEALLESAWDLRLSAFGRDIEWVSPVRTAVLSVTGKSCALACAHCGGRYLEHMLPVQRWRELDASNVKSCLVSGGCNARGRVPVTDHLGIVAELASRWPLNLHLGLASDEDVARIARFSPIVSFDLLVDDATIRDVYGLDVPGEEFIASYEMLRRHVRVVPHICIGIRGGRIAGETDALRALVRSGADAIIFIVFTPTPSTRYAACSPPEPEEAARIVAAARVMFPTTPLYLGCMRPKGAYRDALDSLALRAGINRIVSPSRRAREEAKALGLVATWREECCAF